jgi:hypothetical protein
MSRPVHYSAYGAGAFAFSCFYEEMRERLEALRAAERPGRARTTDELRARWAAERQASRATPPPLRSTDLSKVTCPQCWREIQRLVPSRKDRTP